MGSLCNFLHISDRLSICDLSGERTKTGWGRLEYIKRTLNDVDCETWKDSRDFSPRWDFIFYVFCHWFLSFTLLDNI